MLATGNLFVDGGSMLKARTVIIMFELGAELFRAVERVRRGVGNTAF